MNPDLEFHEFTMDERDLLGRFGLWAVKIDASLEDTLWSDDGDCFADWERAWLSKLLRG